MPRFILVFVVSVLFISVGCKEAQEGADAVSGKITGEQDIENMKKTEKKLKLLQEKTNKQQQDALKKLEN